MNPEKYRPVLPGNEFKTPEKETFAHIFEAKNNPNLIVKEYLKDEAEDVVNDYQLLKKHLENFLPKNQLVIAGKNEKEYKAFLIMEKVGRKELNFSHIQDYCRQLDLLIKTCAGIFLSNRLEPDGTLGDRPEEVIGITPDINERNIIYGTTQTAHEPKLFFTDTYPVLHLTKQKFIGLISELTRPYVNKYDFRLTKKIINDLNSL